MITGKEIILNYCSTVKTHDIEHLQKAIENEKYIKAEKYEMLNGCPSTYGLDNHIGLCEKENIENDFVLQDEQCLKCWKEALEV